MDWWETEVDSLACYAAAAEVVQIRLAWKGGTLAAVLGPSLAGWLQAVLGLDVQSLMQAQHAVWLWDCLPSLDCSPTLDEPGLYFGAASARQTCSFTCT